MAWLGGLKRVRVAWLGGLNRVRVGWVEEGEGWLGWVVEEGESGLVGWVEQGEGWVG